MSMFDKRKSTDTSDQSFRDAEPPAPRPKMTHGVSSARDIAVIGSSITIKGDITGEESLVVDGKVEGSVVLKGHDLTIGKSGLITANVQANVVRIEGRITGDIKGNEKVILTASGQVNGNIVGPRVTLEDGAKFKGSIDMDPGAATDSSKPLKSVPAGSSSSSGGSGSGSASSGGSASAGGAS